MPSRPGRYGPVREDRALSSGGSPRVWSPGESERGGCEAHVGSILADAPVVSGAGSDGSPRTCSASHAFTCSTLVARAYQNSCTVALNSAPTMTAKARKNVNNRNAMGVASAP